MKSYKDLILVHSGVKGMKWGVRKDKKAKKRSEQRKKDLDHLKKRESDERRFGKEYRKDVADLKKNGIRSKRFGYDASFTNREFKEVYGLTKKEALKDQLARSNEFANSHKDAANSYKEMYSTLKQTPINKKTFMDKRRTNQKIQSGLFYSGTILGTSGSIALGVITKSPKVAIGSAIVSSFFGLSAISLKGPETNEHELYKKYK